MSRMNFTPSQKQAVLSQSKNILVSAGAGSGKTAVLTERIVSLFALGKCDADEIAVITFTNAAAAEMKKRIRKRTLEYLKTKEHFTDCGIELDAEARENLKRQLALIEASHISTIHAFCMDIIKNNYYASSCDPAVRPVSGAREEMLLSRAADEVFEEEYLGGDEDFYAFCDAYGSMSDDEALKKLVCRLYTASRTYSNPDAWLEKSMDAYGAQTEEEFETTIGAVFALEYIRSSVKLMTEKLAEAKTYADKYDATHNNTIYLTEEIASLNAYLNNNTSRLTDALEGLGALKMGIYRKNTDFAFGDTVKARIKEAKAILGSPSSGGLKKMFSFGFKEYFEQAHQCGGYVRTVCGLTKKTGARFAELKEQHYSIDFSDMEHICLKVLADKETLGEIQKQYKYVFVDEYQDVSRLQEELITKIAVNGLFTVGDVKQSIYAFRQAEPELFSERYRLYENDPSSGELIAMNENFRSQGDVTEAVNAVFSYIMKSENTGIDYTNTQRLIAKSSLKSLGETPRLYITEENSAEGESAKYTFVAQLIQKLLNERIYDETTGQMRKTLPTDIAVLSRSMNTVRDEYETAIKSLGIPVASGEQSSFYDLTEISLVLDIISVIDNSQNDMPLTSIMRSFIYAFNEDELKEIRDFAPDKPFYYECVYAYAEYGDREELKAKINAMLSQISLFRKYSMDHPVDALLRYIYNATSLFSRFGALPDGRVRQQNLLRLKDTAAQYEAGTLKGLYNFILYTQSARLSKNIRQSSYPSAGVRLLTVHKSKGLEFGIVIITDCEKTFSDADIRGDIVPDRDIGFTIRYRNAEKAYRCDTLPRLIAKERLQKQRYAEEMRILYVAATRAKQKLFFVGAANEKKTEELLDAEYGTYFAGEKSFLEMVARGIHHSGAKVSMGRAVLEESPPTQITQPKKTANDKQCEEMRKAIKDALSYEYPHKALSLLPTKLSVSAVKEGITEAETLEFGSNTVSIKTIPSFAKKQDKIQTALLRGTLTHALLETVSLSEAESDIQKALENAKASLCEKGLFTQQEAALADISAAKWFLSSSLGEKFIRSDKAYREMKFIMNKKASEISPLFASQNETVLIQGVIDLVFEYENKLYLIDYKTDRFHGEEHKQALIEKYSRQIELYNEALSGIFGKRADEAYICFIAEKSSEQAGL